jgi:hypothetical protein
MLFIKESGTHKNRISGPQNIRKIETTQKEE